MHSRRETVRSRKPEHHNVRQRVGSGTECTGASRFENQVGCLQRTNEPTDQPNYQQPTEPSRQNLLFCNTLVFLSCFCQRRRPFPPPPPPPPPPPSPFGDRLPFETATTKTTSSLSGNVFFQGKSLRTVSRHCRIAHTHERRVESVECRLCPSRIHGERRGNYYPGTRRKLSRFNNSNSICQRAKSACADLRYCRRK